MLKGVADRGVHWQKKHLRDLSKRKYRIKLYRLEKLKRLAVAEKFITREMIEDKIALSRERWKAKRADRSIFNKFKKGFLSIFNPRQHAV